MNQCPQAVSCTSFGLQKGNKSFTLRPRSQHDLGLLNMSGVQRISLSAAARHKIHCSTLSLHHRQLLSIHKIPGQDGSFGAVSAQTSGNWNV